MLCFHIAESSTHRAHERGPAITAAYDKKLWVTTCRIRLGIACVPAGGDNGLPITANTHTHTPRTLQIKRQIRSNATRRMREKTNSNENVWSQWVMLPQT